MKTEYFDIEKQEKYTLLYDFVPIKFDNRLSPYVNEKIEDLIKEGVKNIIFDLSYIRYCDSSGLSSLLKANRLCNNNGGSLIICNLNPMVKRLIDLSRLDSIFNIKSTVDEAKQYFLDENA
ncbi:MAG: anti-sigma factor antagonist [Flavobacteriales bacterium]|nr:anti-sigma factor antagonist [Flavobacteriales bacterium]